MVYTCACCTVETQNDSNCIKVPCLQHGILRWKKTTILFLLTNNSFRKTINIEMRNGFDYLFPKYLLSIFTAI